MEPHGNESDAMNGKALEALLRALPVTRILDYGAARTDALALHEPASCVEDWVARAVALAGDRLRVAQRALARGRIATAAQEIEWRAALLNVAQLAYNADTAEKKALYRQAKAAWLQAGELTGEFHALTYAVCGSAAHAVVLPVNRSVGCVLLWGGLSGWGLSYLALARAFARQRVATVLVELPGQGSTRMDSGLFLDAARIGSLAALFDTARVFGAQIGVMGNSLGALVAARFAAHSTTEISACCVNGAPPEVPIPEFRTAREQMLAASGLPEQELAGWLDRLAFRPAEHEVRCPMLIVEGGADPLVPLGAHAAFASHAISQQTLTWPTGEHTIYNFANERNALVSAWFADTFNHSPDSHARRSL